VSDATPPVDLVEFVAKAIVTEPEQVRVRAADGGRTIELETSDDDRGRVIGRQGRVAKAMRAVVNAARGGEGVQVEILD
jgi:predicted RNA-binding protein YlqC (UPF0109 family)